MIKPEWNPSMLSAPIRTPLLVKLGNGEIFHAHYTKPIESAWTWETLSGDHPIQGLNPTHWSWLPTEKQP